MGNIINITYIVKVNMKRKEDYILGKQDEKAVDLFIELGMPKNLAKTLLYVSQVDECRSVDIEQETKLRQPEVSISMQQLLKKGWVTKQDLKKKGKGRPIHVYKPTTRLSEIVKAFEQEKIKEIETIENNLLELKNLIESR